MILFFWNRPKSFDDENGKIIKNSCLSIFFFDSVDEQEISNKMEKTFIFSYLLNEIEVISNKNFVFSSIPYDWIDGIHPEPKYKKQCKRRKLNWIKKKKKIKMIRIVDILILNIDTQSELNLLCTGISHFFFVFWHDVFHFRHLFNFLLFVSFSYLFLFCFPSVFFRNLIESNEVRAKN